MLDFLIKEKPTILSNLQGLLATWNRKDWDTTALLLDFTKKLWHSTTLLFVDCNNAVL